MGAEQASDWRLLEWITAEDDTRDPLKAWLLADDHEKPFLVYGDWILEVKLFAYQEPNYATDEFGERQFAAMAVGYLDDRLKSSFEPEGVIGKLHREPGPNFEDPIFHLPIFHYHNSNRDSSKRLHEQAHREIELRQLKKFLAHVAELLEEAVPAEALVN